MKEYIIHLVPRSSYEIALHSDTLFGAICWGIRMLFGESRLVQVLNQYETAPPFLISSAFPFKFDGKDFRYFLPKPVLKPLSIIDLKTFTQKARAQKQIYHSKKFHTIEIVEKYKKFKKIKFVEISYFKKILKRPDEGTLFTDYLDGLLREPQYCRTETSQKNSLDRLSFSTGGSGNTFYVPEIAYREKFGLFFLLKTENIDEFMKPVLLFLQDSGIGPNARTGKNWFKVDVGQQKMLFDENVGGPDDSFISLSRYIKNEPINAADSFYQIVSVRSKVESRLEFAGEDVWKHRVSYFTAGSFITPKNNGQYFGKLAPVKSIKGKTVYQYGVAYPVWIKRGGKNGN